MTSMRIMRKTQGGVKTRIYYLVNNYVNPYKPSKNNLCKQEKNKNLRNNKDMIRTKPYKGNGVIAAKKTVYMPSFYDTSKFLKLSFDPAIGREEKLQRFVVVLNKIGFFSKEQYNDIYPSGS